MQLSVRHSAVVLVAAIACVAACSSSTVSGFSSGGAGELFPGPSGSAGLPPNAFPPPMQAAVCPARQPTNLESCFGSSQVSPGSETDDVCEYGGSADPACNVIARCSPSSQTWSVDQPTHCPTTCPTHFDERVPGEACSGSELCTYLEATCGCAGAIDGAWTTLGGGSNNTVGDAGDAGDAGAAGSADGGDAGPAAIGRWQCIRAGQGCPARRPVEGARCTKAVDCDYGTCVFGIQLSMTCANGRWAAREVASCP